MHNAYAFNEDANGALRSKKMIMEIPRQSHGIFYTTFQHPFETLDVPFAMFPCEVKTRSDFNVH